MKVSATSIPSSFGGSHSISSCVGCLKFGRPIAHALLEFLMEMPLNAACLLAKPAP